MDAQPQPTARVHAIHLKCALGLTPASAHDGRRENERGIEVREDFAMVKVKMSGPPDRAHLPARTKDELAHALALAAAVHARGVPEASPPVPDGQQCRLQIVLEGSEPLDAAVDMTPPSGPLADLVLELRRWMHGPEPVWPTIDDPEVAACRRAGHREDIAGFHVHEIVIEADGGHRWMFLNPSELSTANHFGCRITNGKPHILHEG